MHGFGEQTRVRKLKDENILEDTEFWQNIVK